MEETFEEYLKEARIDFAKVASKYPVNNHLELRTAIDALLIAYDQAVDKALITPDGYMLTQSASYNEIKLNLSDTVEQSYPLIPKCSVCNVEIHPIFGAKCIAPNCSNENNNG
jgi:hypothetical protein